MTFTCSLNTRRRKNNRPGTIGTGLLALALIGFLLPASCGFSSSQEDAAGIMNHYFTALADQNYAGAVDYFADELLKKTSRPKWEAKLRGYNRQLGNLESFEAVSWNVQRKMGTDAMTLVKVVYQTRYSRRPAVETFILKKGDQGFQIVAHRMTIEDGPPEGRTDYI